MEFLVDLYRRLFNVKPNEAQQALIDADIERILADAEKEAVAKREKEREREAWNKNCPRCRTGSVDRFAQVKGEGSVSGTFALGFGSVYGSSTIDTLKVNHCPSCGHQWEKYERKWDSKEDVVKGYLKYVHYYFRSGIEERYPTLYEAGKEAIFGVFKDIHAESLVQLYKKVYPHTWDDKIEFTVSQARKVLKSVFDKQA